MADVHDPRMQPRIAQIFRRDEQRILASRAGRGREMTRIASGHDFEFSGRGREN